MRNYLIFSNLFTRSRNWYFMRLTGLVFLFLTLTFCMLPAQEKLPVTNIEFNDDTSIIQFAIISDLWGSNRTGVFEDAVEKLELMQPQFVMSLGDLIDGKTEDPAILNTQWGEFNKMISSLSMPFFYVPGNHDISNPWMEKEWKERLGRTYYYFIYNNVLFLCINTQDGGSSGISEEQIAYFRKAIQDHPDVRWTFVFMHRPVWYAVDDREEGYEKIESELIGTNYTLFSGHKHTYLKTTKKGNEHFMLGTTGGGNGMRGEEFGEFDHITWVTLKRDDPPKILNLKLDGMVKNDVVVE